MEFVRSDSREVINNARNGARATWGSYWLAFCISDGYLLVIALPVAAIVSVRAAVWFLVSAVVVWDAVLLWQAKTRSNWVIAACGDRVCVRLFQSRIWGWPVVREPNVLILEASDIASMSARTVELFLYGPKPKVIEWLVIKPADTVAETVSNHIRPLQCGSPNMCGISSTDADEQVFVGDDEGPLTIEWKWCRPALRTFLQEAARECPRIAIGPQKHSELDLNGIWNGWWEEPSAVQRRLLAQAVHLGFSWKCSLLLSMHRNMRFPSPRHAMAYLAELEEQEAETEHYSAVPQ